MCVIDWSIVEKIIRSSHEKFEKEKEFNLEGELNLMRILASYSNILEQNSKFIRFSLSLQSEQNHFRCLIDIDPNKDTEYYHFFLAVSRYMKANGIKDWMEASSYIMRMQNNKPNHISTH